MFIDYLDWIKLLAYAKVAYNEHGSEISGMAMVEDLVIREPVILKQNVTGSTTTLDKEALAMYHAKKLKENPNYNFLWWHTHPKFSAQFSDVDEATIEKDAPSPGKFTAALVFNLDGEYTLKVAVSYPISMSKDCKLHFLHTGIEMNSIKNEIKKLVSKTAIKYYNNVHGLPPSLYSGRPYVPRYDTTKPKGTTSLVKTKEIDVYKDKIVDYMDEVDVLLDLYRDGESTYDSLKLSLKEINAKILKHGVKFRIPGPNHIGYWINGEGLTSESLLQEIYPGGV